MIARRFALAASGHAYIYPGEETGFRAHLLRRDELGEDLGVFDPARVARALGRLRGRRVTFEYPALRRRREAGS